MNDAPEDLNRLRIDRSASAPRRRSGGGGGRWLARAVLLAAVVALVWLFRTPVGGWIDRLRLPEVSVVRIVRTTSGAAGAVSGTAANGYVVARHRAALSADTPGRIVEMNVEEGSVVQEGDVVARLYADELEASLRRAEADLASAHASLTRAEAQEEAARIGLEELDSRTAAAEARVAEARSDLRLATRQHERSVELAKDRVVSQDAVDTALAGMDGARARLAAVEASLAETRAALRTGGSNVAVNAAGVLEARARLPVLQAAVDLARATLDKTYVRAPFDGVIVLKDAEVGEVVSPNAVGSQSRGSVVTMVDFASLEVQVELPETSLSAVALGTPANIYLDAFPDRTYRGTVRTIWPTANRQKATIELRVTFEETDELLRPEMGARVVFSPEEVSQPSATSEPGRILVPEGCVVRVDGQDGVFVLERDVARFRRVEVGGRSSGRVLIQAGVDEGERIVSDPPPSLGDGDRVRRKEST